MSYFCFVRIPVMLELQLHQTCIMLVFPLYHNSITLVFPLCQNDAMLQFSLCQIWNSITSEPCSVTGIPLCQNSIVLLSNCTRTSITFGICVILEFLLHMNKLHWNSIMLELPLPEFYYDGISLHYWNYQMYHSSIMLLKFSCVTE